MIIETDKTSFLDSQIEMYLFFTANISNYVTPCSENEKLVTRVGKFTAHLS